MKNVRVACLLGAFGLMVGCSTTSTTLRYEPVAPIKAGQEAKPVAVVGTITDLRHEEDPRWFGAIRGGFGNPLKKLTGDVPMNESVARSLSAALEARGLLGSSDGALVRVEGSIQVLDCNYYFNRDAHAQLLLNLVDAKSGVLLYSQSQKTDNSEGGVGAGIFGDPAHLADFMQKTLNETIDKFFADPTFMTVVTRGSMTGNTAAAGTAQ
ncbi:MAG TPA: hypothetical protein VFD98_12270 [Terracidiphilus sp.]|jgi:hypothetical protein|nr:hypothetical protein [Terracidiphilus sp.]